jgi:hypothetical protein
MRGSPWSEPEIRDTIKAYFRLLDDQSQDIPRNKSEIYAELALKHPARSSKAFELKFQNISAILYEEQLPYADGLMPRGNYQQLLRLLVLDHLGRTERPDYTPREILMRKLRQVGKRGFIPVRGGGTGRFGLTLEHALGVPPNSSKSADFMGIELKTKQDNSLQTLFSRVPTEYLAATDKRDLVTRYGYFDEKRNRQALYTSFNNSPDTLGFSLAIDKDHLIVRKSGLKLLAYSLEMLEAALLSKHSETAYISVEKRRDPPGKAMCRFTHAVFAKWPSILRFIKLASAGKVYLDFTLSVTEKGVRDHGFLWRIPSDQIGDLYLETTPIELTK